MKLLTALLLMFTLAACSHSDDDKKPGASNPKGEINDDSTVDPNGKEVLQNVTDYSVCDAGNATSVQGDWKIDQASEHFFLSATFRIQNGSVTLTNVCSTLNHSLTARVTSSARISSSSIEVLEAKNDNEKISGHDFNLACDAALQPMRMNYSFQGSCLVLSQPGSAETMTLIPAH